LLLALAWALLRLLSVITQRLEKNGNLVLKVNGKEVLAVRFDIQSEDGRKIESEEASKNGN